ncbi:TerB N-terminal domain-containing protein [Aerococcaceae bacterium WGS1372]
MKTLRLIFNIAGIGLIYDVFTRGSVTTEHGYLITSLSIIVCFFIGLSGKEKEKQIFKNEIKEREINTNSKKETEPSVVESPKKTNELAKVNPKVNKSTLKVRGNRFQIPDDIFKVMYSEKDDLPLMINTDEPLRIDKRLEVKKTFTVDKLPYYPSYRTMTPGQRYKFLEWLQNIDKDIEIGYVFVLFYGIERRILSGDLYPAMEILKKLKQRFDNAPFQDYSNNLLIYLSATQNNSSLLNGVNLKQLKGESLLLIKYSFFGKATPDDLIQSSKSFGFTNHRYVKNEPSKFQQALSSVLEEEFGEPNFLFAKIDLSKLKKVRIAPLANYSIPHERELKINDITSYEPLKNKLFEIMQKSHDIVKVQLRDERKKA